MRLRGAGWLEARDGISSKAGYDDRMAPEHPLPADLGKALAVA
jgi:hypothetical protein